MPTNSAPLAITIAGTLYRYLTRHGVATGGATHYAATCPAAPSSTTSITSCRRYAFDTSPANGMTQRALRRTDIGRQLDILEGDWMTAQPWRGADGMEEGGRTRDVLWENL